MNLNQIKAFLSAADTLSFTRAAEVLYTSQQSVSNQIINLEQDLGCALFVRNNNALALTEAGTRYYQVFSLYLHQGSELLAQIHKGKDQRDHHLRLGISMWMDATGALTELVDDYQKAYPSISVEAIQEHNRPLLSKLKHQELDMVLLSDWQPLGDPDVVCRDIARQEVCLYVPSDIPDAVPAPDCWGLPLYHPASWDFGFFESERILEQRFSALGLTPKHAMACPNLETLRLMLSLTRCVVLSEKQLSLGEPISGYRTIPLHETACYCIRHINNVSKIAENFTQFASNYFYDLQSDVSLRTVPEGEMTMNSYASLFRPLKVGGITLKNRLLSSPTSTSGFDAAGHYSDEIISYYRLKALGGTALVTVGEGIVDLKTGRSKPVQIDLSDPSAEISMRNLVSAIHAGGAMASIQLDHGGALALPKLMGHPAMGPCTYTNHRGDPVVAMTDEDIHRIAEAYGKAAANAKKYGFDMVMLHGGHGWLIHQFISEITNHRTDKWGGSLENRLRFPLLVIEEVRKAVGPKFPIDIRISGSERCPGGYGIETGVEIAKTIDGKVDMIHVSAGTMMDVYSAVLMHPGIFQKPGENSAFAAEIKKHVKTPVCTVGAFSDPDFMVRYLEETGVDAIAMGRALIADPFLPKKLMRGERENITPCLRCTECLSGLQQKERMVCAVNPIIGREKDYFSDMPVRREHRKVLVVGGGPAGIEAALTADSLGHQVTLCEKTGRLGGMLRFADAGDFKSLMKEYRDNQIEKLRHSGVTVKLHTAVDEALIQTLAPDAMILAVGAEPFVPPISGVDGANVIPGCDLVGNELSGRRVTVLGGGLVGCEEALQLARSGYDVSIVEMQKELAPDASAMHRKNLLRQIQDQENITVHVSARCTGITEDTVSAEGADGAAMTIPTDWVVLCAGLRSKTELVDQLRVLVPETYVIGDCAVARNVVAATREGYDAAVALGQ